MEKIDIKTVLNEIDSSLTPVGIRYIKKTGEKGEIYNVLKEAYKKTLTPDSTKVDQKGKLMYHLQSRGVVLLKNADTDEFRSIKKAHMIGFRPAGSTKWLEIWH